ncbi:MAG: RHS repeat-associated core domain-containing protein [Desulfovibrio sp.]
MLFSRYREAIDIPLGFAGGLVDKDTGLIHFGYREYLPDVARWHRPDPLGNAGGDPDVYGYYLDDPINITDKSGLFLFRGSLQFPLTNHPHLSLPFTQKVGTELKIDPTKQEKGLQDFIL